MGWRDRTVRVGDAAVDALAENPLNWRIHPAYQHQSLDAVLDVVGWVRRVIVNEATGVILDGHLRVARAKERGDSTIPARWVDVTPREEALLLYGFDLVTGLATQDADDADRLARQLAAEGFGEGALGYLLATMQKGAEATLASADVFGGGSLAGLSSRVRFRLGVYSFEVAEEVYRVWLDGMKAELGDDAHVLGMGLLERLGFDGPPAEPKEVGEMA